MWKNTLKSCLQEEEEDREAKRINREAKRINREINKQIKKDRSIAYFGLLVASITTCRRNKTGAINVFDFKNNLV